MDKNNVLISIITPCYNAAAVIAETIESVLAQTYQNWEMLICDDCSTDNSVEIIKAYCEKDSRIKLFSTPKNTGTPAEPRNIAIDNANGELVAFLDADDVWLPEKLDQQIDFIKQSNYDLVYSDYEKMSWDGKRDNRIIRMRTCATYKTMLRTSDIPCLVAVVKREKLTNIRFKPISNEDYVFWLELLKTGVVAYNTKKVHGVYREARNSRSSNKWNVAKHHWYILREIEKITLLPSIYYMCVYSVVGLNKYLK